ncbi:MAG: peptidase M15 [Caudovirales sp. ctOwN3]|nr:MAG: peptidase M15 [Caudovirales sp. ctOwN3]
MKLTEHFTYEELIFSQSAVRNGINNEPSEAVKRNLEVLARGLERIRAAILSPIHISSGYRSPAINKLVGGSAKSAHMDGYAADFTAPSFGTPQVIVRTLKRHGLQCDQCIMEGTWVHVSFAPAMRNQFLTATFNNGVAAYSEFKE